MGRSQRSIVTVGQVFSRLTVISPPFLTYRAKSGKGASQAECQCTCGTVKTYAVGSLKNGHSRSCGCLQREVATQVIKKTKTTHGSTRTPEYGVWCSMIARCTNPNIKNYHRYGGRGIKVCRRWTAFENFIADMGRRPSPSHSIGRIHNDKDYSPNNCQWENRRQQCNNTGRNHWLTFEGRTQTMMQWSREYGVNYGTLKNRIRYKWPMKRALGPPTRPNYNKNRKSFTVKGA